MAVEKKRGCGYRKVGGLYLESDAGIWSECDRLPFKLESCPVCGAGIHFTRSMTEIIPSRLFGQHENCKDAIQPCHMCQPNKKQAYIMMVGERYYTPASFIAEGKKLGVSKRIPFIPKGLKLGKTVVYLAHKKAVTLTKKKRQPKSAVEQAEAILNGNKKGSPQGKLLEADKQEYALGIFSAFTPQRVVQLVWEKDLKGKRGKELKAKLRKRGIKPVAIPDGDKDHKP